MTSTSEIELNFFFNWNLNFLSREGYINLCKAGLARLSLSWAWHSSAPACQYIFLVSCVSLWVYEPQTQGEVHPRTIFYFFIDATCMFNGSNELQSNKKRERLMQARDYQTC
jgi:hypothetical protein